MSVYGYNNNYNNGVFNSNASLYSPGRTWNGKPIMYKNNDVMFARVSPHDAQRFMSNEQESSSLSGIEKFALIGMPIISAGLSILGMFFGGEDKS